MMLVASRPEFMSKDQINTRAKQYQGWRTNLWNGEIAKRVSLSGLSHRNAPMS